MLVHGSESVLADRAVAGVVARSRAADPDLDVVRIEAAGYEAGMLATFTSPSLFGEAKLVVVAGVEAANEAFVTDVLAYLAAPDPEVVVVLVHRGGNRGKKILDAARGIGAPVVDAAPLKDSAKPDFVVAEFRRADRRVEPGAVRALVDAVGSDLRELASAVAQLISDTEGTVDAEAVERYYGGRVEASAFKVADAAVAGRFGQALALWRHALSTGAQPVPMVAVLAMKLRGMAKVAAAGRGRGAEVARAAGMAPWQVDRARRDLEHWTPDALARAIMAVAAADAEVKGAGRDPGYAVERALGVIAGAAGGGPGPRR